MNDQKLSLDAHPSSDHVAWLGGRNRDPILKVLKEKFPKISEMIKLDLYAVIIPFSRVTQSPASWAIVWRILQSLKVNDDMDFYQGLDERATRHINPACYRTGSTWEKHDARKNMVCFSGHHFNSQFAARRAKRL